MRRAQPEHRGVNDLLSDPFGDAENEIKYEVDRFRLEAIATLLALGCRPDPRYPANTVVSLYYDTPERTLLREKLDSHYLKTKVRLRWYEDPGGHAGPAMLEVKRRIGSRRRKARLPAGLTGEEISRLGFHSPRLLALPDRLRAAGIEVAGPLLPLLEVRYRRRRFVEPLSGARIALDTLIRGVGPERAPIRPLAGGVLEIKGAGPTPPAVLTHLVAAGCYETSFSKYFRCYRQLAGEARWVG
jgi:hypothetical protein